MIRALALLVLAVPAVAQTVDPTPYRAVVDACLAQPAASDAQMRSCIGEVASLCMVREDGGDTTFGMTSCTRMENTLWDDVLNADWPGHRAAARSVDAVERGSSTGDLGVAEERLLTAQRAWLAFRDADCAAAAARWGAGTMRHIEHAACFLDHTANRVIDLRAQWEMY